MALMTLIFIFYAMVVAINSSVIPLSNNIANESSTKSMFRNFMITNHRNYTNDVERARRFAIFVENLTYIASLNALYNESVFGITKFADYTSEELQKVAMKVSRRYNDEQIINYAEEVGLSIPGFFDWRKEYKVTAVKDQGGCNSCWAFAAVAVIESLHAIESNELIDLSEQQLIECDVNSDGCIFGYPSTAYLVGKRRGLLTESQFSYRGVKNGACPPESGKIFVKLIQKIKPNADAIADYVYNFGPVSVNLRLTKPLYHYTTGIFHPSESECESSNDYHVWTIVGFGETTNEQYWIIKNSWGMNWGSEGFIYFVRGKNACGIESYPYSATI